MSTIVERLPSRHKVSWKGWIIALIAAAMVAAAFGSYVALRGGASSSPAIVQTVKPTIPVIPEKNLQSGEAPGGARILEERNVGGIDGTVTQSTSGATDLGTADTGGTSSNAPAGSSTNCLYAVRGGPC
jgi:hypothetical protein